MPTEDFEKRIDQTTENIQESDAIGETNTSLILDYKRDEMLNGLGEATILKNLSRLKVLAENSDKPFNEMDKSDVKDMVAWAQSQDYADSTVYTYKNVICSFWQWLTDDDEPEATEWIQLKNPSEDGTLPQDLLTREDIEAQVEAAKNERDKAFIYMLYETGARIGELIDLTVGDIEDNDHGRKVVIDGKTGSRRLPLIASVPYLNEWLGKHPNPEKDAPLWCKIQQGNPDDKLGYRYLREKVLKKNMERAGIDKPSNPHHYRHSRASHLATEMTEAQLCEWFGWVQGSDVPQRYVHLSGRDLDNDYLAMHGIEPEDEQQGDDKPEVIECPRCSELNQPKATFCMQCGFGLDQDAAEDFEAEAEDDVKQDYRDIEPGDSMAEKLETLDELMNDPEIKSFLEQEN